jgi:hypothetical protein
VPEFGPYETPQALLRDQLWRCWLAVEYQIRHRWAMGALPRTGDDGAAAAWAPENVAGVFRSALSEYRGEPLLDGNDAGAAVLRDAHRHHSMLMDARIAATVGANIRLPYLDLCVRFGLSYAQRLALSFALMPEVDPKLLIAYRYLSSDPRRSPRAPAAMLVYDTESRAGCRAIWRRPRRCRLPADQQDETAGVRLVLFRRLRPAARGQLLAGDAATDPQLSSRRAARRRRRRAVPGRSARGRAGLARAMLVLRVRGGKRLLSGTAARLGRKLLLWARSRRCPAQARPLITASCASAGCSTRSRAPNRRRDLQQGERASAGVRQPARRQARGAIAVTLAAIGCRGSTSGRWCRSRSRSRRSPSAHAGVARAALPHRRRVPVATFRCAGRCDRAGRPGGARRAPGVDGPPDSGARLAVRNQPTTGSCGSAAAGSVRVQGPGPTATRAATRDRRRLRAPESAGWGSGARRGFGHSPATRASASR